MKHCKLIRLLSALLALVLLLTIAPQLNLTARAVETSGTCGEDLIWTFEEATGTLIISGYGVMEDFFYSSFNPDDPFDDHPYIGTPWFGLSDQITEVLLLRGVESIGSVAFMNCKNLKRVTIPRTVTSIGVMAFSNCSSLTSVEIPDGVKYMDEMAFDRCTSLTSVKIPATVYYISDNMFYGCTSLTDVVISKGVGGIGDHVFCECTALNELSIPGSIERIGMGAFQNTAYVNDPSHWSGKLLFLDHWLIGAGESLGALTLPQGTRGIADRVLGWRKDLTSVTIPGTVRRLDFDAFAYCENLTNLVIQDGLKTIEGEAFLGCKRLTTVILPPSLVGVSYRVFSQCSNLRTVVVSNRDCYISDEPDTLGDPKTVTIYGYIDSPADDYAYHYRYAFVDLDSNPFIDVSAAAFYAEPVGWAVEKGVANGTSPHVFSPDSTCTRAQVVTFLWRAMGEPQPTLKANPFTDVAADQYYYSAVLWAVEQGITTGTSATTFSPNAGCTRGQVVTFLWRAEGQPVPAGSVNPFKDVAAGRYDYQAVLWAVEKEITKGTAPDRFSPDSTCTRGQIVTFLYRDMK